MSRFDLTRRHALALAAAGALASCARRSEADAPEGLLRVAIANEPDSLDPLKGQFASSALLYKQLHAPLTEYSPTGGLAPGLADGWRSPDGRVWTFRLNPGLVWSDGTPLTAQDVVWTARRAVDPRTGFADLGDFFAVENAKAALAGEAAPETIGVEAPDLHTVIFRLDQPVGLFPVFMREFYPLPRHAVEANPDRWTRAENWVGAGPYVLESQSALSYRLVRNPSFHAASSVSIPAVRVEVVEDAATRTRLFRAGDLDLADQPPPEQIGFLKEQIGDRMKSFEAPILSYLKINHARPALADVRVRQAISLAIDRAFLADQFFDGEASPTETVIPSEAPAAPADLDTARTLLAAAGYEPGTPLRLSLRTTSGGRERLAVAIADDLSRIGVEIEILATYPVDMFQAVDAGEFDLALSRFDRGLKSDPNFMLQPFGPEGFADDGGWRGPVREDFDALMNQARATINAEMRSTLYHEAERLLLARQAIVPLLHERAFWMVSDRVTGVRGEVQPMLWRDLGLAG